MNRIVRYRGFIFFVLGSLSLLLLAQNCTEKVVERPIGKDVIDATLASSLEQDSDGDGLVDVRETELGTHLNLRDSDGDGLSDGEEVNTHNSDPLDIDSDDGGITDGIEVARGTNPNLNIDDILPGFDSDEDGLTDQREMELGLNPVNPDTDGDGLLDGAEVNTFKTDPFDADTDNGGVNDGPEVEAGTSPANNSADDALIAADGDEDGITDAAEAGFGTDPEKFDTDGDGLSDGAEVNTIGSNPLVKDTDGGGVEDGREVLIGTNPLLSADDGTDAGLLDLDGDGLINSEEARFSTDPNDADTDGDGLSDGAEVLTYKSNPLRRDTDSGGEPDGAEVSAGRDPLNPSDDVPFVPLRVILIKAPALETVAKAGEFLFKAADSSRVREVRCGIDPASLDALVACTENTPFNFEDLGLGAHSFFVQITDTDGHRHTARYRWIIIDAPEVADCDDVENLKTKTMSVDFARVDQTCAYGAGDNLARRNVHNQAQGVQTYRADLPTGAKICKVEFDFPKQRFHFDDHFVLSWNDRALATNADYLLTMGADGFKQYDFLKIRGTRWGDDRAFCLGSGSGSKCQIPRTDSNGQMDISLDPATVGQVTELANDPARQNFTLSIIGDNDNRDCKHGGLNFEVKYTYAD